MVEQGLSLTVGRSSDGLQSRAVPRTLWRLAQFIVLFGIVGILLSVVLVPRLTGLRAVVVSGGSMGDALPVGSLAWLSRVAPTDMRQGDVALVSKGTPFLHRIVAAESSGDSVAFQTKGDMNDSADPLPLVVLVDATLERVMFSVPLLGYPVSAIQIPAVRAGFVALLLLGAVSELWRSGLRKALS